MHHQLQTLDSQSVITFSTKRPRMLVPRSFIAHNAPTESCRCTTRIPWYHQNRAYTHRILFPLTAWMGISTWVRWNLYIMSQGPDSGPLTRCSWYQILAGAEVANAKTQKITLPQCLQINILIIIAFCVSYVWKRKINSKLRSLICSSIICSRHDPSNIFWQVWLTYILKYKTICIL